MALLVSFALPVILWLGLALVSEQIRRRRTVTRAHKFLFAMLSLGFLFAYMLLGAAIGRSGHLVALGVAGTAESVAIALLVHVQWRAGFAGSPNSAGGERQVAAS